MTTAHDECVAGGSFLIRDAPALEVFTPEDLSEEQQMMRRLTHEFIEAEVKPHAERIEHQDWDLTLTLIGKAGELGLLSVDIPTRYGGLGLDMITSTVIAEQMIEAGSFAISLLDTPGSGRFRSPGSAMRNKRPAICPCSLPGKRSALRPDGTGLRI